MAFYFFNSSYEDPGDIWDDDTVLTGEQIIRFTHH